VQRRIREVLSATRTFLPRRIFAKRHADRTALASIWNMSSRTGTCRFRTCTKPPRQPPKLKLPHGTNQFPPMTGPWVQIEIFFPTLSINTARAIPENLLAKSKSGRPTQHQPAEHATSTAAWPDRPRPIWLRLPGSGCFLTFGKKR